VTQRLTQWTAPHSIRWYGPGQRCTNPTAGDLILVDHGTDVSLGIKSGEWLIAHLPVFGEPELRPYTWLDHCAVIREDVPGVFTVSEMGPSGHKLRPLETYQDRLYAVINFEVSSEGRGLVLAADQRFHDVDYGFIQYPFLVVNGLTGARIAASYGSSMICSTHVTMVSQNIYFSPDRQASAVIPSHIAMWVGATPPSGM
jgi:hypothetical protein